MQTHSFRSGAQRFATNSVYSVKPQVNLYGTADHSGLTLELGRPFVPEHDGFRPGHEVFQPAYPLGPEGVPGFVTPPKWLPPVTDFPGTEVPFEFPKELPTTPGQKEWGQLPPAPSEIPDWSKAPLELPTPGGPEVYTPKNFPAKTFPDGVWYLS